MNVISVNEKNSMIYFSDMIFGCYLIIEKVVIVCIRIFFVTYRIWILLIDFFAFSYLILVENKEKKNEESDEEY